MSRLAALVGRRANTSPANAASWLVSLVVLAVAIPANDKIGPNKIFFVAHGIEPVAWVLVLLAFLAVLWLALWLVLRVVHARASARAYDITASALTFALTWFLAGNALTIAAFPTLPYLGPAVGLLVAVAVTWFARRFAMGTALLVVSAVAAAVPLFGTATQQSTAPVPPFAFDSSAQQPNVVWVVSDELSYPTVMDAAGEVRDQFPNLQALQRESTTYTRAYANANFTDYAVPGMLAGISDVAALAPEQLQQVRANLGIVPGFAADYSIVFESPLYRFACDSTDCVARGTDEQPLPARLWSFTKDVAAITGNTVLAEPFVTVFPSIDGKWKDFWAGGDEFGEDAEVDTVGKVIAGLEQSVAATPNDPFFAVWHSIRTHGPYPLDRDGRQIFPARVPITEGAHMVGAHANETFATDELRSLDSRLKANVAIEMDRQVGELVGALKALGRYDDTLIVFTADHGAAATRFNTRRTGDDPVQMWSEIAHVPLLVKAPGQTTPQMDRGVRSTGQIARTVMEQVGAQVPEGLRLSPSLGEELPGGPVFATVTTDGPTAHPFPDLPEVDPWLADDLEPPNPAHPFAIGIDLGLLDRPLPADALEQPAQLTTFDGVSDLQLIVAERGAPACGPQSVGLVTAPREGGSVVIGSVLWEGEDGRRGWAIVPRTPDGIYALACLR